MASSTETLALDLGGVGDEFAHGLGRFAGFLAGDLVVGDGAEFEVLNAVKTPRDRSYYNRN